MESCNGHASTSCHAICNRLKKKIKKVLSGRDDEDRNRDDERGLRVNNRDSHKSSCRYRDLQKRKKEAVKRVNETKDLVTFAG